MGHPIASAELKAHVLNHVYTEDGVTPLPGFTYLAARHNRTNVGIFILNGVFTRDVFKAAIKEAKVAALRTPRMYVYAELSTYSGPGIQFTKLDDIGIQKLQS